MSTGSTDHGEDALLQVDSIESDVYDVIDYLLNKICGPKVMKFLSVSGKNSFFIFYNQRVIK